MQPQHRSLAAYTPNASFLLMVTLEFLWGMCLIYSLSQSQIQTHEQYLHSVGLWTKQQIDSTGAVRGTSFTHCLMQNPPASPVQFPLVHPLQHILSHEQMLYKLFAFIGCHVADIICLGTLSCKVPNLATTPACEWCTELPLCCIHIHGSRTRGHGWCWDHRYDVQTNNRWW